MGAEAGRVRDQESARPGQLPASGQGVEDALEDRVAVGLELCLEVLLLALRRQLGDVLLVRDAQQHVAQVGARVEANGPSGHDQAVEESLCDWLTVTRTTVLDKSSLAAAIDYCLRQWKALTRYTEHGFLGADPLWRSSRSASSPRPCSLASRSIS